MFAAVGSRLKEIVSIPVARRIPLWSHAALITKYQHFPSIAARTTNKKRKAELDVTDEPPTKKARVSSSNINKLTEGEAIAEANELDVTNEPLVKKARVCSSNVNELSDEGAIERDNKPDKPSVNYQQTQAAIFRLSPELRNKICELVLVETEPEGSPDPIKLGYSESNTPGWLCTCRRARKEYMDMYYWRNVFEMDLRDKKHAGEVRRWVACAQPDSINTIRHFRVVLPYTRWFKHLDIGLHVDIDADVYYIGMFASVRRSRFTTNNATHRDRYHMLRQDLAGEGLHTLRKILATNTGSGKRALTRIVDTFTAHNVEYVAMPPRGTRGL